MSFALYCPLFGILVLSLKTDAGELTWKEPLPIQTVQDDNITNHRSKILVTLNEGNTNAIIRWHFVLKDLTFHSLTIWFGGQVIAGIRSSKQGPEPGFENRFGISWIESQNVATFTIFNLQLTTDANRLFRCEVSTVRGFGTFLFSSSVQVNIVAPPSNIVTSSDQNVKPPAELTLNCSANGKPKPTVTWTRVFDNSLVPIKPKLHITGGKDAGTYRCTAGNGVGNPLHKDVKVNVLLPPKVTLPKRVLAGREQTARLICEVEGNPKPNISWSGCDQPNHLCDKQYLIVLKVQNPRTNYTCTGRNYLGSDSATTFLIIAGNSAYMRLSACGECEDKDSIWETLENKLSEVFANTQSYIGAKEIHVSSRSGSLIFDVVLNFKSLVTEDDIISSIQTTIKDGKLGNLRVNVSFIIGNTPVEQPTTENLKISPPESHGSTGLIIGVVLGSCALVALIVFIIWCVCKKIVLWIGTKDSNPVRYGCGAVNCRQKNTCPLHGNCL